MTALSRAPSGGGFPSRPAAGRDPGSPGPVAVHALDTTMTAFRRRLRITTAAPRPSRGKPPSHARRHELHHHAFGDAYALLASVADHRHTAGTRTVRGPGPSGPAPGAERRVANHTHDGTFGRWDCCGNFLRRAAPLYRLCSSRAATLCIRTADASSVTPSAVTCRRSCANCWTRVRRPGSLVATASRHAAVMTAGSCRPLRRCRAASIIARRDGVLRTTSGRSIVRARAPMASATTYGGGSSNAPGVSRVCCTKGSTTGATCSPNLASPSCARRPVPSAAASDEITRGFVE